MDVFESGFPVLRIRENCTQPVMAIVDVGNAFYFDNFVRAYEHDCAMEMSKSLYSQMPNLSYTRTCHAL
jgi:hypothetical protein